MTKSIRQKYKAHTVSLSETLSSQYRQNKVGERIKTLSFMHLISSCKMSKNIYPYETRGISMTMNVSCSLCWTKLTVYFSFVWENYRLLGASLRVVTGPEDNVAWDRMTLFQGLGCWYSMRKYKLQDQCFFGWNSVRLVQRYTPLWWRAFVIVTSVTPRNDVSRAIKT